MYAAQIRFTEGLKTKLFRSEKEAETYLNKRYPENDSRIIDIKDSNKWPGAW